ncbi:hypothetical protein LY28_03314 [Ruminiclostridium sufflavum DSM 19573]|uniref:Uncharacterized protein n=1 Tax=Ruminiclostridium sufflavum DSM 19573 TaxID=1121337 RepID=A0A318Y246_9FIRM|nr:hypothetical protein [Ruminiclostridium sufflavum]PYG85626.1 hypothetical protein LY28_03314 [Ruminiclostridium sufflavum DSM 19573]
MGFFNEFLSKNKSNIKLVYKDDSKKSDEGGSEKSQSTDGQTDEKKLTEKDFVECYDERGQKIFISRDEMKNTVLPEQFKNHWNTADALYNDILLALKDEFNDEALDAAKHLVHIDENKERGYTTLAAAYLAKDLYGEAEKTLNEYIKLFGKTGIILTNLARVHYSIGERERALELIWESLCMDPNQEATLQWWIILNSEAEDKKQYLDLLKKITAINGSWLPQLYLARYYLEQRDLESAKPVYEYVLSTAADELPVLYIISGDLGNNGYIDEIIDIAAPLYDVDKHDVMAGLNILHAYIQTRNYIEGQMLVNKMMKLGRPDVRAVLLKLSEDFEIIKKSDSKNSNTNEKIEYELVVTDKPIWYYGLKSPEWLLPKDLKKENIGFLSFADLTDKTEKVTELQLEDETGRMTRSIPLMLQEVLLFKFNAESKLLVPIVKDIGPAVTKAEYSSTQLADAARTNDLDLLVTGCITANQDGYGVKVILFESGSQSVRSYETKLSGTENNDDFVESINNITDEIAKAINIEAAEPNYYNTPSGDIAFNYLSALGQSLMQSLVDNRFVKFENLWGERNILNCYLSLALSAPENPVLKIMLVSGLAKSKSYGSEVYKEFREQTVKLLSDEQSENDPIKLLVPFVYYLYDMKKEFIAVMDSNSKLN